MPKPKQLGREYFLEVVITVLLVVLIALVINLTVNLVPAFTLRSATAPSGGIELGETTGTQLVTPGTYTFPQASDYEGFDNPGGVINFADPDDLLCAANCSDVIVSLLAICQTYNLSCLYYADTGSLIVEPQEGSLVDPTCQWIAENMVIPFAGTGCFEPYEALDCNEDFSGSLIESVQQIGAAAVQAAATPYTGAGVRVGIVDTGADMDPVFLPEAAFVYTHDFTCKKNCDKEDVSEDLQFDEHHGTIIARIVASRSPDYPGVAPGASLMIAKVFDEPNVDDQDGKALLTTVVKAIRALREGEDGKANTVSDNAHVILLPLTTGEEKIDNVFFTDEVNDPAAQPKYSKTSCIAKTTYTCADGKNGKCKKPSYASVYKEVLKATQQGISVVVSAGDHFRGATVGGEAKPLGMPFPGCLAGVSDKGDGYLPVIAVTSHYDQDSATLPGTSGDPSYTYFGAAASCVDVPVEGGHVCAANCGSAVTISAPGQAITLAPADDLLANGDPDDFLAPYVYYGTSAAAAHVAGVVALALDKDPDLPPAEVKYSLVARANPTGGATGPCYGGGLVDAFHFVLPEEFLVSCYGV